MERKDHVDAAGAAAMVCRNLLPAFTCSSAFGKTIFAPGITVPICQVIHRRNDLQALRLHLQNSSDYVIERVSSQTGAC